MGLSCVSMYDDKPINRSANQSISARLKSNLMARLSVLELLCTLVEQIERVFSPLTTVRASALSCTLVDTASFCLFNFQSLTPKSVSFSLLRALKDTSARIVPLTT